MKKVGITGGIGAGKSIVCEVLSSFGIPVFNADLTAKNITNQDLSAQHKIKKIFGEDIFFSDGTLDRVKMADLVFKRTDLIDKLNAIIHPLVRNAFIQWCDQQNAPYVVEEAAILFESGADQLMDYVIMVYCDKEIRIQRTIKRNGYSREKVESVMFNQMDEEEKCKKANFILFNNEKTLLLPQIIEIHKILLT